MSIYYLLAKFGFDTAENEPCKVFPLSVYGSGLSLLLLRILQVMEPCVVSVQKNFPGEWPTDQELLPSLLSIDRLEYEEGKKANEMNSETSPLELVDRADHHHLLAVVAHPHRDGSAPEAVAGDGPIARVEEPVVEALLLDVRRHPVGLVVIGD